MVNHKQPPYIEEKNLSYAWARTFLHLIDNRGKEVSPLVISITGFANGEPDEDGRIREELDRSLLACGEQEVHTVANTIFAPSLWRLAKYDRHRLYDIYLKTLPRYKALAPKKNCRGIYFERLIAFGPEPDGNQLEYIIKEYTSRSGVRRSMFQASIFDPDRDHNHSARLVFPCLQHISFVPQGNSLTLNAFYATQFLFEKAYGNYLGLCRLGQFMAYEMGLTFGRMNCFTGVENLGKISKTSPNIASLIEAARNAIDASDF